MSSSSFFVSTNLLKKLTNATITPTTCDGDPIILVDNQQPTQQVKEQIIDRNNSTDSSDESFYSSPSLDAMTITPTPTGDHERQYSSQSRRSSSSSSIYGYGDDIPSLVAEAMKLDNIISSITTTSKSSTVAKRVMNDMSRLSGIKSKKE